MRRHWLAIPIAAALIALCAALYTMIPAQGTRAFLSPDETANAVSARVFSATGAMRIAEPSSDVSPWLHPRSYVTSGGWIVPVGFLGLPFILGVLHFFLGDLALAYFTAFLVLITAYPIWVWGKRFGRWPAIAAVTVWLAHPTVILYANRGLFPNLPVVCLAVWAAYLIWSKRDPFRMAGAGIACGLAIAIRPVELFWLIPWLWLAWHLRETKMPQRKERVAFIVFIIATALVGAAVGVVAWMTYGAPFTIGYFLHDPIAAAVSAGPAIARTAASWPFGVHPRDVFFNVYWYLGAILGPWSALAVGAAVVSLWKKSWRPAVVIGAWTFVVLAAMYGEAIYQDHVGVNVVSTANSFLRYVIPLAPVFAMAAAGLVHVLRQKMKKGSGLLVAVLCLLIVSYGVWTATVRDDEGIRQSLVELSGYGAIRDAAEQTLSPDAVVVSERSDKIFFPVFRSASPLPGNGKLLAEINNGDPVYLYSQTLTDDRIASFSDDGIGLDPVFVAGDQTMYIASSLNP